MVLASQFESLIHPFTVLLAVPLAVTGALVTLKLAGSTINLYSQIGMILLIGLVTKNSILLVEYANQLKERGMSAADAILEVGPHPAAPDPHDVGRPPSRARCRSRSGSARAPSAAARSGMPSSGGVLFSTILTLYPGAGVLAPRRGTSRERKRHPVAAGAPVPATAVAGERE